MGQTRKKKKNQQKQQRQQQRQNQPRSAIKREPLDQVILDSIGSPNAWTPEAEDAWINELRKLSAGEIYKRFPPMKKPPNARKRPKGSGWGDRIN